MNDEQGALFDFDDEATTSVRSFSYGGGVQSTAALVLAAQGRIDFPLFLMANVGEDSEDPRTLEYVRAVAQPYAVANGIELQVIQKRRKDGTPETLYDKLTRDGSRSMSIPYRSKKDGPPMSRSCTAEFKARVLARHLRTLGATEESPAIVGLGISLDEIHRANTSRAEKGERIVYPLVGIGEDTGLRLRRGDCEQLIRDAGLPVPPKSSCYFCPHHKLSAWAEQRRTRPDLFDRAATLEETLNSRSLANGTGPVFLSRAGIPLREAVDNGQDILDFDDTGCDSGWCFT